VWRGRRHGSQDKEYTEGQGEGLRLRLHHCPFESVAAQHVGRGGPPSLLTTGAGGAGAAGACLSAHTCQPTPYANQQGSRQHVLAASACSQLAVPCLMAPGRPAPCNPGPIHCATLSSPPCLPLQPPPPPRPPPSPRPRPHRLMLVHQDRGVLGAGAAVVQGGAGVVVAPAHVQRSNSACAQACWGGDGGGVRGKKGGGGAPCWVRRALGMMFWVQGTASGWCNLHGVAAFTRSSRAPGSVG
jgi:hypothetical protein